MMKQSSKTLGVFICLAGLLLLSAKPAHAQMGIVEAVRYAAKKVIKAVDLKIQRLQNKTIDLQNIQKQIENQLSKLKLTEIGDWTRRQKEIYQVYFDELWRVKTLILYYKRITEIIHQQKQLVSEYKRAVKLFDELSAFSPEELDYIHTVYNGIIDQSLQSLDQILLIMESFTLQMSDGDRLDLLNRSANEIENYTADLRSFTNRNIQLCLRNRQELKDVDLLKIFYGIDQ